MEVARDWLSGSDDVLERLARDVTWRQRRRRMYDRMLDEPRLTRWCQAGAELPDPALVEFRNEMARRCRVRFSAMGLNYYRDGHDSVAFHADRELRHLDDTLVAILTVGAPRPFLLRPYWAGRSLDLRPGPGDVLVMGGACQARWEHAVPKVAAAGPRISASIRWVRHPRGSGGAIGSSPTASPPPASALTGILRSVVGPPVVAVGHGIVEACPSV